MNVFGNVQTVPITTEKIQGKKEAKGKERKRERSGEIVKENILKY